MNKKVCLVSLNLAGGGAQRAMISQAEMFAKNGYQVDIIIMKSTVHYNLDLNLYNFHYLSETRFLSKIKLKNFILFFQKLKTKIALLEKDKEFDLILSNSYDSDQLLRFFQHKNIYHIIHGTMSVYMKDWPFIKKLLYRSIYKNQKVIAVSNGVKLDFLNILKASPKKILTIYNAFDVKKIRELSINPVPFSDYVLFVGSINSIKRLDILLHAYKKSDISQKLILLGFSLDETKYEQDIRALIKELGISKKVECLNFVNNPFNYIKNADFLILSSDHEGLPSVLIEALILNTMVISTSSFTGPSEILKGPLSKFLSEKGNIDQLSDNMVKVANIKIEIGIEYYENFDSNKIFTQYVDLINE